MAHVDVDGEPLFDMPGPDDDDHDEIDQLFRVAPTPPPAGKRARKEAPPPPGKKVAPAAAAKKDREAQPLPQMVVAVLFPDVCDYDGLSDWVYVSSISYKINGHLRGALPSTLVVSNLERMQLGIKRLWRRVREFRGQVKAAWAHVCRESGNPDMAKVAAQMSQCKLVVHNTKSKHLAENPLCAWSGHNTELRSLALVPIEGTTIALGTPKPSEGIMFHVQTRFVDMLKCVHTLLFLLDYINADIEDRMSKPWPEMMGDWGPAMDAYWQRAFMLSADTPLSALLKRVKDMVKANCAALKASLPAEVGAQYFVPIAVGQ
jgi:hypothetical protein